MAARTVQALQADTGPDIRLLLHITTGYCGPAAAAATRPLRNSVRLNTCDRSWRARTR